VAAHLLHEPLPGGSRVNCDERLSHTRGEPHEETTPAELARDGMTMICVTHEMGFARQAADRVVMMDGGAIIEDGPPEHFFTAPTHERTKQFLAKIL
jgi:ABC-type polar amino acid transport system ATPase subunit